MNRFASGGFVTIDGPNAIGKATTAHLVTKTLRSGVPALDAGQAIICDRHVPSAYVLDRADGLASASCSRFHSVEDRDHRRERAWFRDVFSALRQSNYPVRCLDVGDDEAAITSQVVDVIYRSVGGQA